MRIRIKKKALLKDIKIDSVSKIDDVFVNENLLNPEKSDINLYFRGQDSSGILTLKQGELDELVKKIKPVTEVRTKKIKSR